MQPYFFPYIGYFQLIKTVDKFVFYDDVNFIKNGWINRNKILNNGDPAYLTIQLKNASSFKQINDIEFTDNRNKLRKTLESNYKKAPFFYDFWPILENVLTYNTQLISELAIHSIIQVSNYLNLSTSFEISSKAYAESKMFGRKERLIEICHHNAASVYINPIGGKKLYSQSEFKEIGIKLQFIKSNSVEYKQFKFSFVPWLSIIDILMFNSKEKVLKLLDQFTIE